MQLNLVRNPSENDCTFGTLTVDGQNPIYTLERLEVQIPTGTYNIEMTDSLDLTCRCPDGSISHLLPLLDGVPGRSDIRIHGGNWPRDTEGCILVGLQTSPGSNMILQSQAALTPLVAQIQQAIAAGDEVTISIS
jgi:hypothetical protein